MKKDKLTAYAEVCGSKAHGSTAAWYRIYFPEDSKAPTRSDWKGPYRDKTDAENAAYDEAKNRNLNLEWVR